MRAILIAAWIGAITIAGAFEQSTTMWVTAGGQRLKTRIYQSARLSDHPVLVVVLHGDSPFRPPSYQYEFARRAAAQIDNVAVAALLRPGYTDDSGERSDGERGLTTGDNYTPEVVDAVAEVVRTLKAKFHPAATVLAGHSGGAAITGDLIGRHPAEVNAALMVSCPCDLAAWRKHMLQLQGNRIWLQPVTSLSPTDLAKQVPSTTRVRMVVGSKDGVAPPELTQQYAETLRKQGVDVRVTVVPGLEHDILLEPVVIEQLKTLVTTINQHPN